MITNYKPTNRDPVLFLESSEPRKTQTEIIYGTETYGISKTKKVISISRKERKVKRKETQRFFESLIEAL
jgi:hypothetical protein